MRILFTILFALSSICVASAQHIEGEGVELDTLQRATEEVVISTSIGAPSRVEQVVDIIGALEAVEAVSELLYKRADDEAMIGEEIPAAQIHSDRIVSEEHFERVMVEADERALEEGILTPNEARKMRGFTSDITFVPDGQWIFGGTASYSLHHNDNFDVLVISDIASEGYTVNIAPMIAYAPWKNMAVGLRFAYGRSLLGIDNADLSIGEGDTGVNINVDMFHKIKHDYTGTLFWRPYIPLGRNNRFAIFAELQLNMSYAQGKIVMTDGVIDGLQNYRGTYSSTFGASIALQPGIVAFVTNNTALELSIGVFGIGYDKIGQSFNQVEEGSYLSSNMNFNVNLLSIGFGVSFYL